MVPIYLAACYGHRKTANVGRFASWNLGNIDVMDKAGHVAHATSKANLTAGADQPATDVIDAEAFELASLEEVWDRFDEDKSGEISLEEFVDMLTHFNYLGTNASVVYCFLDPNGDDIDRGEFFDSLSMMQNKVDKLAKMVEGKTRAQQRKVPIVPKSEAEKKRDREGKPAERKSATGEGNTDGPRKRAGGVGQDVDIEEESFGADAKGRSSVDIREMKREKRKRKDRAAVARDNMMDSQSVSEMVNEEHAWSVQHDRGRDTLQGDDASREAIAQHMLEKKKAEVASFTKRLSQDFEDVDLEEILKMQIEDELKTGDMISSDNKMSNKSGLGINSF